MQLACGTELANGSLICDSKRTKPFRHGECRTYLPIQQRNQPPLLLLSAAIAGQNLWIEEEVRGMSQTDFRWKARYSYTYVAGVWCRAVHHFGAHVPKPSHDFRHNSVLQHV